jgi:hypothetical protein
MKRLLIFIFFTLTLFIGFMGCAVPIYKSTELTPGKLDFETEYDSVHVESRINGNVQHMRKFYFKDSKIVCETYYVTLAAAAYAKVRYSDEKYYYPDGKLKYEEITKRNNIMTETDYDESGKVTKRDKKYVIRDKWKF